MIVRLRFVLIAALLCVNAAVAANRCHLQALHTVLLEVYDEPYVYHCNGQCFFNALELARVVEDRLGASVPLEDLNIMIIRHRDLEGIMVREAPLAHNIYPASPRLTPDLQKNPTATWNYHVVVEHDGVILDLDLDGPAGALPAPEYFQRQFPSREATLIRPESKHPEDRASHARVYNAWDDIEVILVPAQAYLRRFDTQRRQVLYGNELGYIEGFPRQPAWDYIRDHVPRR